MANGNLKANGSILELKNKYGSGYKLQLVCSDELNIAIVKEIINEINPQIKLIREASTSLVYSLQKDQVKYLEKIFTSFEKTNLPLLNDFGLSISCHFYFFLIFIFIFFFFIFLFFKLE